MPEYVILKPNYESTLKFLAMAVASGQHEQPFLAIYSILDQMRYLTIKDRAAADRVVEYFKQASANYSPDEHLEADYEDRNGYPDVD